MLFKEFKEKFQKNTVNERANKVSPQPVVSVCVQTYQHKNYLKDCLDGILMQQTDFPLEILLGDDESNDGTRGICIEYAGKYPDKIRLFLHKRENNIHIKGTPTGRFNFMYNLYVARGKYIALCEGDDYWIDPLKLQKQVDFLEQNVEYGICFHQVLILDQETGKKIPDYLTRIVPENTDVVDLAEGNFIHTPSVLLRNNFRLSGWFTQAAIGDWALYMLQVKKQKIKKLNEVMAVYRIHSGGVWANKSKQNRTELTRLTVKLIYKNVSFERNVKKILKSRIEHGKKNNMFKATYIRILKKIKL